MKCPNCGTEHNFNFCPNCGYKAQQQAPVSPPSISNTPQQYASEAPQYELPYNTPEYADQPPKKGGLRWWGILLIVLASILLLIGIVMIIGVATAINGNNGSAVSGIVGTTSEIVSSEAPAELTEAEIDQLYTDPGAFKGRRVTLTGRVFQNPEKDRNVMYFQIFTDIENSDRNTVIAYQSDEALVAVDDYVRVTGVVQGEDRGYNAFGGIISAPRVLADSIEIVSYAEAAAPSLKTVELSGVTQDQYGYSVTVHKVEFAEKETRVYVSIQNNGSSSFSVYSFNTKIVQDGKQYEEERNYRADYPEIQTDLQPGASTQGVIAFPAMNQSDFQIIFEGYSDNWDESIEDYTFNITVQ